MGARSSRNTTQNNRSDGHLLEYFRNTFVRGGGGTNFVPPEYSVSPSTASINEGSSVTFTVTTANVPNATTLYWSLNTVSGTINTSDFTGAAVTGSFSITSNTGSVVLALANDTTTEGSESFQLQVRTGSTSGTIVATSSTVTIGDTSLTPSVTGGTIFTYGGKTIHVFTSTSPTGLVISNTNLPSVEYVMVGGGGAGGANYSGGGGAGGYLTGTFPLPGPGGPYPVTIGAGGNAVLPTPPPGNVGGNGSNTVFNSITAYGGGGGGYFSGAPSGSDGTPGASGGGAGGSNAYQTVAGTGNRIAGTGTPIPQQGYPGAQGFAPQYFATGGGGGGAGGAAANPVNNGGPGHDSSPGGPGLQAPVTFRDPANPYGTPGPNPGGFYFGGGGGAARTHGNPPSPLGGAGGGGRGSGDNPVLSGTVNTGGGGGGTSAGGYSGGGGSGIVIIAY